MTVYAQSGRQNGMRHSQRERLFQSIFEHLAQLGDQPILVCIDANVPIDGSTHLSAVLATGRWRDVAAHFAQGDPEPTFCADPNWDRFSAGVGVTRPDLILANNPAMALCSDFQLRRDLPVKGHLGLQLTLDVARVHAKVHQLHLRPPVLCLNFPR